MTTAAAISLICGLMFAGLFYMGIRYRDPWSILVVLLAWAVNYFLGTDQLLAGNVTRIVSTGIVVLLLIDRLTINPEHVKNVLASQLQETRRELHDQTADRASWEARAVAYKLLLDKHHIKF